MRQHYVTLVIVFVAVIFACAAVSAKVEQETVVFGTRAKITVLDMPPDAADRAIVEVFKYFEDMHPRFHPWRDGELKRVNDNIAAGALPMSLSAPMADILRQARIYSAQGLELFNPAIGNLIDLWGFNAETLPAVPPSAADIKRLLSPPPLMHDVAISGNRLLSSPPHIRINLSAIAKGAALDAAREILRRHSVRHALVNIGGTIMALGKNGNRHWRVALHGDRQAPPLAVVRLKDGEVVSTSGGSVRSFAHAGKRYHHILDPRTGYSAENQWTAIVINDHPDNAGAIADAASTALVIANEAETAIILENFNLTLAWQRRWDGEDRVTEALEERIEQ